MRTPFLFFLTRTVKEALSIAKLSGAWTVNVCEVAMSTMFLFDFFFY